MTWFCLWFHANLFSHDCLRLKQQMDSSKYLDLTASVLYISASVLRSYCICIIYYCICFQMYVLSLVWLSWWCSNCRWRKKGMELAVSLSLFASRVQEIRVPFQVLSHAFSYIRNSFNGEHVKQKKSRKLGTFTRHSFFDFFIKYDNRNFSIEIYKFYGFTGTSVMQVVCNYSHTLKMHLWASFNLCIQVYLGWFADTMMKFASCLLHETKYEITLCLAHLHVLNFCLR